MEDTQIIDLYFARNELAIRETEQKYGLYCFQVADRILKDREDSEETVSDALLHTWNAVPPERPVALRPFLAKITRNLAFSRWRCRSAAKRGGGEMALVLDELAWCIPGGECPEQRLEEKELALTIRRFLDTLPLREQDIFLRRYFYVEESDKIAARHGMKPGNVLRVLSRTRKKLKTYLTQEGYDL